MFWFESTDFRSLHLYVNKDVALPSDYNGTPNGNGFYELQFSVCVQDTNTAYNECSGDFVLEYKDNCPSSLLAFAAKPV